MKIYSLKKHRLKEVNSSRFKLEKDIQSLVEKNLDELFGYDLIQSEFVLGGFRLDSLCYDKSNNSVVIIEYKKGKTKLLGYFVGESMKLSKGKANPKILNQILIKKLKED